MKSEFSDTDIRDLLEYAGDHAKLFNDINRAIYRRFDICTPAAVTLLIVWVIGELNLEEMED